MKQLIPIKMIAQQEQFFCSFATKFAPFLFRTGTLIVSELYERALCDSPCVVSSCPVMSTGSKPTGPQHWTGYKPSNCFSQLEDANDGEHIIT